MPGTEPTTVDLNNPVTAALQSARDMISKIKLAMVRVYYVFVKPAVQDGLKQIPDMIREIIKKGVEVVVKAVETVVKAIQTVREKGRAVVELLKEVPNVVASAADLLDEGAARAAQLGARIAAFVAVFVDEAADDIAKMLTLFTKILSAVAGNADAAYKPGTELGLTAAQLGFDPATGPT